MSSHEWTALYGIVAEHYPHFVQEIEDYLKYGLLEHGFLRVHLDAVTHGTRRQLARPAYKPPPDHPWKRAYPDQLA